MKRDSNSTYTYYGWCSSLPFRTIFFPTPAILETTSVSDLPVAQRIISHLRKYNNCRTVGDVLDLSDADILSMRFSGPKTLFELRVGLLEIVGGVLELHEYFYDPDVVRYIQDVRIGMVAKNALLDSRKWMASLYYSKISRMKKGSDYR